MTRPPLAVLLALAATAVLTACGSKQEETTAPPVKQRLTLVLDYFPNADHAGIYSAQARGDFARAGLDVKIVTPSDPSAPLKLLQAGKADLAISYEPELLLARDKGAKLVAVGALVNQPLTSIVSLGSAKIAKPSDLEGKTVGTSGIPYQSAYLKTILAKAGVDPARVHEVNVGFDLVRAMLSKKVDATLGSFWNYEGVQLQRMHKKPSIIRVGRAGVPTYDELVFVAREAGLREPNRGALVRRFVQALQAGTRALRADPAAAVRALVAANRDLEPGLQLASVKQTLPAFFPPDTASPFGYQDEAQWKAYGEWMLRNRLLTRPANAGALTNEFLPGEGVKPGETQPGDPQTP